MGPLRRRRGDSSGGLAGRPPNYDQRYREGDSRIALGGADTQKRTASVKHPLLTDLYGRYRLRSCTRWLQFEWADTMHHQTRVACRLLFGFNSPNVHRGIASAPSLGKGKSMQTPTIQSLHDSAFLRLLGSHAAHIIRDAVPKDVKTRRQTLFTRNLTEQEQHTRSALIAAAHLVNVCDQLVFATQLLSGYRSNQSGDTLITRFDYIRFQIENYYLRIGMVVDRALQLVNVIFDLGLPRRECKYSAVAKNVDVTATHAPDELDKLRKVVAPYYEERNIISHQSSFYDDELCWVEMYSMLQKSSERESDPVLQRTAYVSKREADEVVKRRRSEFQSTNARVFDSVGFLFEALIEPYNDRHHLLLNPTQNS